MTRPSQRVIANPETRQAYIDAGREPVKRSIDYDDKDQPITLNDTFGFFQMSFIDAYEGYGISFTLEEAKILVEGKRKRGIMASLPMKQVQLYQEMELRVLCRLTDKLRETAGSLGLDLPHWQGAGAISSAMATKHRARDFYPRIRAVNHLPVQEWAHHCFAGGRIEMVKQGRATGKSQLYGYDITSAYPSIQYGLPAMALPVEWEMKKDGSLGKVKRLKEGKWIWREGGACNRSASVPPEGEEGTDAGAQGELAADIIRTMSIYSMIEVEFSFPEKCFDQNANKPIRGELRNAASYPLFYRRKDGSILFPARGIGRYYRDELLAAFEWVRRSRPDMNEQQQARMIKLRGGFEFICPTIDDLTPEQLTALKDNCPSARIDEKTSLVYPFHYIKEYYDQRALYPKTDSRNKILKLGINGAWGKTAQSIGGKDGRPPPDASPWYAGVVTAGTRAKCVLAGLKAPWNIIHFATDGIQSDAPLNIESDKKMLGEWEMDTFSRGAYVKPGVYAFVNDFMRDKDERSPLDELVADHLFKGKSRGVSLRSVLGEDADDDKERNIQEEWFDYLDELAEDCYGSGRPLASLPHKKLLTLEAPRLARSGGLCVAIGSKAHAFSKWIRQVSNARIVWMKAARIVWLSPRLPRTKHRRCCRQNTSRNGSAKLRRSCAIFTKTKNWPWPMIGTIRAMWEMSSFTFFIEQAGTTITARGGRLQLRRHGEYDEINPHIRTIVASGSGFVITSDAMRMCAKKHVEVIITDATQSFVAVYASYAVGNASRAGLAVRMKQFAAPADMRKKVTIAKGIVRRKIAAEKHDTVCRRAFLADLEACKTVADVRHVEAKTAQEWWRQWKTFELRFTKGFAPPTQWRSFKTRYIGRAQGRVGELAKQFTARFAETPLQALHNFGVAITATRFVRIIAARGLDPWFGFLHDGRKPGRYSLAWDAIEVLRPGLATAVFDYAGEREFERGEFMSQDGVVRLSSHIAKECAEVVLKTISIAMLVREVKRIESAL